MSATINLLKNVQKYELIWMLLVNSEFLCIWEHSGLVVEHGRAELRESELEFHSCRMSLGKKHELQCTGLHAVSCGLVPT